MDPDMTNPDVAQLTIERVHHSHAVVSRVVGELDLASAPSLRDELNDLVRAGSPVVVDLDGVSFMDSTGLSVMVAGFSRFKERGLDFVLSRPQAQVLRVLEISGLDRVLTICDSENDALERLASSADPGS